MSLLESKFVFHFLSYPQPYISIDFWFCFLCVPNQMEHRANVILQQLGYVLQL
jgi:hypothetical protein